MALASQESTPQVQEGTRDEGNKRKEDSPGSTQSATSSNREKSPEITAPKQSTEEGARASEDGAQNGNGSATALHRRRSVRELIETRETESKMEVGHGVMLIADITGAELVVIKGNFNGTIKAQCIDIEQGAEVKGSIECEAARVNGVFDGEMLSHHSLHLASHGNVSGKIIYRRLKVAKGAQLYGHAIYRSPVQSAM